MNELLARLNEIGEKAAYLNHKSQLLVEENRTLSARIQDLEKELTSREAEVADLMGKYEIIQLARTMEGDDEGRNEELKQKINEYIREIDQCLRLLGD